MIKRIGNVGNWDSKEFAMLVSKETEKMQDEELTVEIQYSTQLVGDKIFQCALIIGRE